MKEIFRSPHVVIELDALRRRVRVTRSAAPIASPAAVDAMVRSVRGELDRLGRAGLLVLVDLRQAPLRIETDLAAPMAALRVELTRGVKRTAFLTGTVVGMLQVRRFLREQGIVAQVFDDEQAAMDHLLQTPTLPGPPR